MATANEMNAYNSALTGGASDVSSMTPTALSTAAPTATSAAPAAGSVSDISLSNILDSLARSNTGKGAAMGALMGQLLSSYKSPGGVNLGVDMSQLGRIAPRTLTTAAPRYIPYSQYGAMEQVPQMSPQMMQDFGISTGGLQYPSSSGQSFSRVPEMQGAAPMSFTSAGSGTGVQTMPRLTPRAENTISPLTGALLGSALGYLTTPSGGTSGSGTSGGGTSGGGAGGLGQLAGDAFRWLQGKFSGTKLPYNPKAPDYQVGPEGPATGGTGGSGFPINPDIGGGSTYEPSYEYNADDFGGTEPSYTPPYIAPPADVFSGGNYTPDYDSYSPDDYSWGFKEGGMATPMMAEGGATPHYYTYGKAINPSDILSGMAHGGEAQKGGLPTHVPTVEGRHDYRSGSRVTGEGTGQSDDIPAMLADGEYVFDADTVAALGDGSTKAGSDILDRFREELRAHKRSAPVNKIPPPAKSPLAYLKAARSKRNG